MADPADLRAIAHELYGLRPEEFTAARTEAESRAKAAGDKKLAKAVKGLRRPAVAAWAVNLLVRERAELVEQVVGLGDALRQAQSLLQGDALRELAKQRRQLVAAVTTEVRKLAKGEGQKLSDAATRQVEDTLQAAMTDRTAADAVLSGLLAQPLTSTGLDSLAEVLAVPLESGAAPAPAADTKGKPRLSVVRDDGRARREAEERVTAAGGAVRAASQAHDEAVAEQAEGQARVLQLEAEADELRRKLAEVEQAAEDAAETLTDLEAETEEAAATLADARAEAGEAAAALKALGRE
jgi:hypothetical protein